MADLALEKTVATTQPNPDTAAKSQPFRVGRSTVLPRVEVASGAPALSSSTRDRFEELEQLGSGGMGEVMLLKDNDIEREVAVKRVTASSPAEVMRFVEEIRTIGQLEHPNIVPLHDVGIDSHGRYFFVMKRLQGHTLEDIINRLKAGDAKMHERFGFGARIDLLRGVLNALSYAHARGFIHRDLKPANIMVGPYGEVTVVDWGLAKRVRAPELPTAASDTAELNLVKTHAGAVMGTPLYMSPEQAKGLVEQLDQRCDLYSLAVIAWELFTLTHYLEGKDSMVEVLAGVIHQEPPDGAVYALSSKVPAEILWFVRRGMQKDVSKRYQSAAEMLKVLDGVATGYFAVQCQRTLVKRTLYGLLHLVDNRPALAMAVTTVSALLVVGAVVRAIVSFF